MMWGVYAILSALFAALVAICAKVGLQGIDSNLATAIRTVVVVLITWGVAMATVPLTRVAELTTRNWIFLVLSGVCTGVSWLFYFRALQLAPVSKVAPIDKMSVALVIVLSFLLLNERPDWNVILGGLLIVIGSLVMLLPPVP